MGALGWAREAAGVFLLKAGARLLGFGYQDAEVEALAPEAEEPEEEDQPHAFPAATLTEEGARMVAEGMRAEPSREEPRTAEAPLVGSPRERITRARREMGTR